MSTVRLFLLLLLAVPPGTVVAQLPTSRLYTVFPPGSRQGASVEVVIGGQDLEEVIGLTFSHPGIAATAVQREPGFLEDGPQRVPGRFVVAVAADVPRGIYSVRAQGKFGLSNPRAFQVDALEEVVEVEPNNTFETARDVPAACVISGRIDGGADLDCFRFPAKAGERVVITGFAERIDSRLDGILTLFGPAGNELAKARGDLGRDPVIDFTPAADGAHVVRVHDFLYGGSAEHVYRLSISRLPHVDLVYPPAGPAGAKGPFTVFGRNLPGGQPSPLRLPGGALLQMLPVEIELPADAAALDAFPGLLDSPEALGLDGVAFRLEAGGVASFPAFVGIATAPVVLEDEPNNEPSKAQRVARPCEVAGRFYPHLDDDWYSFEAKGGEVIWIEVISARLGLPTDPAIVVQSVQVSDKGEESAQEVASQDDAGDSVGGNVFSTASSDPTLRFQAPQDGIYRILLRDLAGGTAADDPRLVYRLSLRGAAPDFRLAAMPRFPFPNVDPNAFAPNVASPFLRQGGTEAMEVYAFRRDGFDSPIEVVAEGLPASIRARPLFLGAGVTRGTLVLEALEGVRQWAGPVRVVGKAQVGGTEVSRAARAAFVVWPAVPDVTRHRVRGLGGLTVALSGSELAPFTVTAPARVTWSRPGKVAVPLTVVRRPGFEGPITVTPTTLPPNVKAGAVTIDPKASSATIELELAPNAPPGKHELFLVAGSTASYSRNADVVATLAERKARVEKAAADIEARRAKLVEARAQAAKALEELAKAGAKAREAQAKGGAGDAQPILDELKAAADQADQAAAALRAKAEADVAEVEALFQRANEAKGAVAKELEAATGAAKPANVALAYPVASVQLQIESAPFQWRVHAPAGPARAGTRADVVAVVERQFGFADPITLAVALPGGLTGIGVPSLALSGDASAAVLSLDLAPNATPGRHRITVKASAKWGGQDVSLSQEVEVVVEAPSAEAPK